MSIRALNWAWEQRTGAPAVKAVLVVLADLADEEHSCWPSPEHICEKAEVSERSVRRHLVQLEELGLIKKERRYAGYGNRLNNRYVLDVEGQISSTRSLEANLAGNEEADEKPQVTPLEANLAGNEEADAPLEANCGRYIETPHEIDKSIINHHLPEPTGPAYSAPSGKAASRLDDDSFSESDPVDEALMRIHPSLTKGAIASRLKTVPVESVDLVQAATVIVGRASQPIGSFPAFVAAAIERAPHAWPRTTTGRELGAGEPQRSVAQECTEGRHDWGPASWPEFSRAHCQHCSIARSSVDPVFAAAEAREWDLPSMAEGAV